MPPTATSTTVKVGGVTALSLAGLYLARRWQKRRDEAQRLQEIATETIADPSSAFLKSLSQDLLTDMIQYAELHGLVYADKEREADPSRANQVPLAMLPFKIPAQAFHNAVAMSPHWNQLVDSVARDLTYLYPTLESAAAADPFTGRLLEISKAIHKEGLRQKIMLGIHRSDYMLHEPEGATEAPRFLQVELNTIASSMASHAQNAETVHRFMLGRYTAGPSKNAQAIKDFFGKPDGDLLQHMPANRTLETIPAAIAQAHQAYCGTSPQTSVVTLFVVQPEERNFADQRWLEYALWEKHGVCVVRKTLTELQKEATLHEASGKLMLSSGLEVSVVYFRAGYTPDDYPSELEWEARLLLERSLAIKCPSVDYQLVGAKKVQQALARPGVLEKFLGTAESTQLRTCFAGLWGLGPGEDDAQTLQQAFEKPSFYVLKPQREGGGNNFYGEDVAIKLKQMSVQERGAYILMQRILPRLQKTIMTRAGRAIVSPGLSEFGFYSVFLGDGQKVLLSEHAGHLVRTKAEGVDEGGVAAGYAVISSPFLVEEKANL